MDPEQDVERAPEEEPAGYDIVQRVLDDLSYSRTFFDPWLQAIAEEILLALDNQQWFDTGDERDSDRILPKDMAIMSAIRRKAAQLAAAPLQPQTFAVDQTVDPISRSYADGALKHELFNSRNLLRRMRARAIFGSLNARLWYLHYEWDSRLRRIVYDTLAPDCVYPQPGALDIHDDRCNYVILRVPITAEGAYQRARANGASEETLEKLRAPMAGGTSGASAARQSADPGATALTTTDAPGPGTSLRTYSLLVAMYRTDPEELEREDEGEAEQLEPDEQFMRCYTCNYETREHPMDPVTGELPELGEPCPQCAKDGLEAPALERVDQLQPVATVQLYPNGRWVEVVEELNLQINVDENWPYHLPRGGTLDTYPLGQYRVYDDPRYMVPPSDVSMQYNQQLLATHMLGWAVEQMRMSGRVIIAPFNQLVDSRGRPFKFSNRVDQFAYIKDIAAFQALKDFQPAGLPQGWDTLYSALTSSFRAFMGTGELGLSPQQSKDIPVGTVRTIVESGDIPADEALRKIRDEDGIVFTGILQMMQASIVEPQGWAWPGPDGQRQFAEFAGADIGDVDVVVLGDPAFDASNAAELERMQVWFNMTPPQRRFAARALNLDAMQVAEYERDEAMWMQQMAAQMGPAPAPGEPGRGGEPGIPGAGSSGVPSYADLFGPAETAAAGGV